MENTSIEQFIDSLKQEAAMLREILANLSLEEMVLIKSDREAWLRLKEEISQLYLHLDIARDMRRKAASRAFPGQLEPEKAVPTEEAYRCEISFWQEQLAALMEKLQSQTLRNELLSKLAKELPLQQVEPKKRKNGIATIPPEEG